METSAFDFVQENYPLAAHTRYRIGGKARYAFFPRTTQEAEKAQRWLGEQGLPVLTLGGGSNVLIDDRGFPGGVLFTTELKQLDSLEDDRYLVGAGVPLHELVRGIMTPRNYAGVGALTGIPGTVGGALYMNAGTVNGSICEFVEEVMLLDNGRMATIAVTPALYGYRGQRFCVGDAAIVEARFRFHPSDKDESAIYERYLKRREETQPKGQCCGSVFKNPPNDHAGRLIEACGLKGVRRGGAVVSEKHANFIMNEDNATFDDVFGLIGHVKEQVCAQFGVVLEEEVRIIRLSGGR